MYQIRVPVPIGKGVRKSLRTADRTSAIERAEDLVSRFLKTKSAGIREEDEEKVDAGRRSTNPPQWTPTSWEITA